MLNDFESRLASRPRNVGIAIQAPDAAIDDARDHQKNVLACAMRNHNGRILIGQLLESLN